MSFWDLFKDNRPICSHCNEEKTENEFEGLPTCEYCKHKILLERRINAEKVYYCPDCETPMKKICIDEIDIIKDQCPKCKGVFLNHNELEIITDYLKEEYSDGGGDMVTGMLIGGIVGSQIGGFGGK